MHILHISDLHFGNHDEFLQKDLARHVKSLQPDLIICTGDIADTPSPDYLKKGLQYLEELRDRGKDLEGKDLEPASLIVVPGNHDYRNSGWLWNDWSLAYEGAFQGKETQGFFKMANPPVWVFGFNSAAQGEFGGSGKVDAAEIERFHAAYDALKDDPRFADAFKIVALHHHPLPVTRRHANRAKWLTLINSGEFLTAMLFRKIDLILHGHEHLQAQSEFGSTLGDNRHKIAISSLGATLRKMKGEEERNWFGVITVDPHEVKADFYSPVGQTWSPIPTAKAFVIRSRGTSAMFDWQNTRDDRGYFYRELASITVLDGDGDARRSIECEDLTPLRKDIPRTKTHELELPASSGVLCCLRAHLQDGGKIAVTAQLPAQRGKGGTATLQFNPIVNRPTSYIIKWHALNSFAMDQRQFDYQYSKDQAALDNTEYTHYVVLDPIENFTVIVQFPRGFTPATKPVIRVTRPDPSEPDSRKWKVEPDVQNALEEEHALHFYTTMNAAALRVTRPAQNLSYGIEWRLPPVAHEGWSQQREKLKVSAKQFKTMKSSDQEKLLRAMLRIIVATRDSFLEQSEWTGALTATIMYFDGEHMLDIVISALQQAPEDGVTGIQYDLQLLYGDGIAGRAFKVNQPKVYVAPTGTVDDEDVPDYYVHHASTPEFKVVVALPLHIPENDLVFGADNRVYQSKMPYGVLNLSSESSDCPLALLLNIERLGAVLRFQHSANQLIYEALTSISR